MDTAQVSPICGGADGALRISTSFLLQYALLRASDMYEQAQSACR
jgi:hypothetical protein